MSGEGLQVVQWLGGGLSGGVGARIAGGDFLMGMQQGLLTGGLNHAAHSIMEDCCGGAFSKLVNLEELSILNSQIENLQGISTLRNLKFLRLANLKRIASLKGVENLQKLEELEIQRCKGISTVFEVFRLSSLRRLLLLDLGNIASIGGIETLSDLEEFLLYESTNIVDGDISPVLTLKNLSKISFQNRRHYTHKREDFGKLYA